MGGQPLGGIVGDEFDNKKPGPKGTIKKPGPKGTIKNQTPQTSFSMIGRSINFDWTKYNFLVITVERPI